MRLPFDGRNRVTSPYGTRTMNGKQQWHGGLDIVGDDSTDIHAVCGGRVGFAGMVNDKARGGSTWQWGYYVRIDADDGRKYYYCHQACAPRVKAGQRVATGDVLGTMGNTGYSFGAHTHFEVRSISTGKQLNAAAVLGIANCKGTLRQTAQGSAATCRRTVTATTLNVRSAPGTQYGVVGQLHAGDGVQPGETANGWGYLPGKGWICLAYTKEGTL